MKKIITIALLAAMAAGFTGCSSNDEEFSSEVSSVSEALESFIEAHDPDNSSEAEVSSETEESSEISADAADEDKFVIKGEPLTSPVEYVKFHGGEIRFYPKWDDFMLQFRGMPDIWGSCNYSSFGTEDYDRIFDFEANPDRSASYTTKIGLTESAADYRDLKTKHNVDACCFDLMSDAESDNGLISGCDSSVFSVYDGTAVINGHDIVIGTSTEQDIYDCLGTENMKGMPQYDMETMEQHMMYLEYNLTGYDLNFIYFDLNDEGIVEMVRVKEGK